MPIRDVLLEIIRNYPGNKYNKSAINPKMSWFGLDAPYGIRDSINLDRYVVKASPGMGNNAADVSWIGIRRPEITSGFTSGVYVVYLFAADRSGVYLSLMQGVTAVLGTRTGDYHPTAAGALELRRRRDGMRLVLDVPDRFSYEPIDLHSKETRGRQYEDGHICGKFYSVHSMPNEESLISDLSDMLAFYDQYAPAMLDHAELADRGTGSDSQPGGKRAYIIGRKRQPSGRNRKDVDLEAWRQAQERRQTSHQILLDAIALHARHHKREFSDTKHIDLIVDDKFLIEAKSLRGDDRAQVRAALAQLYDYRFLYRSTFESPILVAIFDAMPSGDLGPFLYECGIHVLWKTPVGFSGLPDSLDAVEWMQ